MASNTIHELPAEERPREKLLAKGAGALSDSELVAILLRTGLPGANAVDVARQLLQKHGSLSALARCTVPELSKVPGIGPAKALQLGAAFGLASRLAKESIGRLAIERPEQVSELLGAEMRPLLRESLRVVLLDTRMQVQRIEEVSSGTLNETVAHPREFLRPAIIYSAYAVILVHNHPSGDPSPSEADRRLTTRLLEAARLLQVRFYDHVIIGNGDNGRQPWFSFREAGMM